MTSLWLIILLSAILTCKGFLAFRFFALIPNERERRDLLVSKKLQTQFLIIESKFLRIEGRFANMKSLNG